MMIYQIHFKRLLKPTIFKGMRLINNIKRIITSQIFYLIVVRK